MGVKFTFASKSFQTFLYANLLLLIFLFWICMEYLRAMAFINFESLELVIFFELVHDKVLGLWNLIHQQKIGLNKIFFIHLIKGTHTLIKLLYSLILPCNLKILKVFPTLNDYLPVSFDLVLFHEPFRYNIFWNSIYWIFLGPSTIFWAYLILNLLLSLVLMNFKNI